MQSLRIYSFISTVFIHLCWSALVMATLHPAMAKPLSQEPTNREEKLTQTPAQVRGISHYLKIRQKDVSRQDKETKRPLSPQADENSNARQDTYHFHHLKSATELLKNKSVDERPATPINRYIFLDSRRDRRVDKDGVHHSSKRVGVPSVR